MLQPLLPGAPTPPTGGLIDAQTAALSARRLAGELYRQTGPAKVAAAAEHVRALLDAGGPQGSATGGHRVPCPARHRLCGWPEEEAHRGWPAGQRLSPGLVSPAPAPAHPACRAKGSGVCAPHRGAGCSAAAGAGGDALCAHRRAGEARGRGARGWGGVWVGWVGWGWVGRGWGRVGGEGDAGIAGAVPSRPGICPTWLRSIVHASACLFLPSSLVPACAHHQCAAVCYAVCAPPCR